MISCSKEWWFEFMEDSMLQPDRVSFCAMLNCCAKKQDTSRAEASPSNCIRVLHYIASFIYCTYVCIYILIAITILLLCMFVRMRNTIE